MKEEMVYLDSSAIIKRYIEEPGSLEIRSLYKKTYAGEIVVSHSLWDVGEVLGAFDRARSLERIAEDDYHTVKRRFLNEIRLLSKQNAFTYLSQSSATSTNTVTLLYS